MATPELSERHPGVQNLMRWLTPNPNLPYQQSLVAQLIYGVADDLVDTIPEGPELIEGLRKLLEAKDCFVRASFPPPGTPSPYDEPVPPARNDKVN